MPSYYDRRKRFEFVNPDTFMVILTVQSLVLLPTKRKLKNTLLGMHLREVDGVNEITMTGANVLNLPQPFEGNQFNIKKKYLNISQHVSEVLILG